MPHSLEISCANLQDRHAVDEPRLIEAVKRSLVTGGVDSGEISVAVVDNERMHALNRQYLDHDYPTDVLSFVLDRQGNRLEGEIIVSTDYAAAEAKHYGWPAENELLLYVVHGALHLIGHDDTTKEAAALMRQQERAILGTFGLAPPGRE